MIMIIIDNMPATDEEQEEMELGEGRGGWVEGKWLIITITMRIQ